MITVYKVSSPKQLKTFIQLPKRIYRGYPHWVPPLWHEEIKGYDARKNPILQASRHALFIAELDGAACGRILVYIDNDFNRYFSANLGFFAAFESVNDETVWSALFTAAEKWLAENGAEGIRGPINPVAEHWGMLIDGYDDDPVFLSPYNPPYYNYACEKAGYTKAKDLLAYSADMHSGYKIPTRFMNFRDKFFSRNPGFSMRKIDVKNITRDAEIVWRLSNETFKDNWGYVPVGREIMEDMLDRLKIIIDANAVWFIEDKGCPVGFCLGYPNVNPLIKQIQGHLFPFGFISFFSGLKKLETYRLFGLGVLEEYHGKGLDVLLYTQLQEALSAKQIHMEANYILEDNMSIKNALEKLGMTHTKTYRVYEKKF